MVGLETNQEQQPSRNKGQWMEKGEPGRRAIATTTIITIPTTTITTTIITIIITTTITIVTTVTTTVVVKAQPGQGGPGLGWAGLPRQPGQSWPPLLTSTHSTLTTVAQLTKIL